MSKRTTRKRGSNLLPIPVILAAASGDTGAIRAVLKHYEGYIVALSLKKLYDEDGREYLFVDEDIRRELETHLITKILKFKPKAA